MAAKDERKRDYSYNDSQRDRTLRYIKNKQKTITVRYRKEVFENEIKPAIDRSGKPVNTFIKEAVVEKIERDKLN